MSTSSKGIVGCGTCRQQTRLQPYLWAANVEQCVCVDSKPKQSRSLRREDRDRRDLTKTLSSTDTQLVVWSPWISFKLKQTGARDAPHWPRFKLNLVLQLMWELIGEIKFLFSYNPFTSEGKFRPPEIEMRLWMSHSFELAFSRLGTCQTIESQVSRQTGRAQVSRRLQWQTMPFAGLSQLAAATCWAWRREKLACQGLEDRGKPKWKPAGVVIGGGPREKQKLLMRFCANQAKGAALADFGRWKSAAQVCVSFCCWRWATLL